MAAVKLNVLHLHASDFCRFAVESKLFPNLTASLTGIHAGHYTQAPRGRSLWARRVLGGETRVPSRPPLKVAVERVRTRRRTCAR